MDHFLFFGDSITVGQGLARPETERWSARVAAARGVGEINEGRGGRPASALAEFRTVLDGRRDETGITALVLALGANDAREEAADIAVTTARHVAALIDWTREAAPHWNITVCSPYGINRACLQRQEIAALRERNLVAIGAALREMAETRACLYVDFEGVLPLGSLVADGVHPDASGHEALATAFLAQQT